MTTAINDDIFTPEVIAGPYTYFGRLREEDPVHWNEKYQEWVITSYKDLMWVTRHPESFSSAVLRNDPRPPYPEMENSDQELYEFIKYFRGSRFIEYDRPEHPEMRMMVHGWFPPRPLESWRPLVKSVINEL